MPALRETPSDYRQHLEIETPEHVVLDLEIAGIGSRALAAVLDMAILVGSSLAVLIVLSILSGYGVKLGRVAPVLLAIGGFVVWNGYFILFEGLRRGQTPGKRIVGIRVVMDTGHAITFGAAAARNLLRIADFLPPPYLIGLLLVAFHPRAKRLGDLVAGTVVSRDRPQESWGVPREHPADEAPPSIPELDDETFRLVSQFAARQADLAPAARTRLAAGLAARLGDHPAAAGQSDVAHVLALHAAELARRQGGLSARGAAGAGTRFAAQKRRRWDEFERLAERAATSGLDSFESRELPDFAARYREVAADLARARTYRADPATQSRLERLAAAGHNALYRDERSTWRQIWIVLARECPAAVVEARRYVLLAFLTFMVPAAAGFAVLRERPALAAELLPDVMLRRAEAGQSRKAAGRGYVDVAPEDRALMASGIITNNVRVAIACFAGGVFLGVGSLVLLAYNGLAIGAFAGHFANAGLLDYLLTFILGHGALELFAIWVAGAAGFLLGRSVVAPGRLSRSDALVVSGRLAVRMVGATALLLVVAGLIEGFVSAGGYGVGTRLAASAVSLGLLAAYLLNGVRSLARSSASGSPATRSLSAP
ncbi:MAG TPA: stage II sporulation protein M [Gemmatimonadales bacterium]|nr:stage II sporulation protein M [Gemmatimonadales bacterium]